jgi:O-antigen/teichoic acid export membrane protein
MRVRSATWVAAAQAYSRVVAFPLSVILARALGVTGKGELSEVQIVIATGIAVLGLGANASFTYYAAKGSVRGRDGLRLVGLAALVLTIAIVLFDLAFAPWIALTLLQLPSVALFWAATLLIVPALASNALMGLAFGSGRVRDVSLATALTVTIQLVGYGTLWALGRLDVWSAFAVLAVSTLVELAVMAWLASGVTASELAEHERVAHLARRMWTYGSAVWIAGMVGFAALRVDTYFIAFHRGPASVGIYSIAVTLAELCWFIPIALGTVMMPKVAGSDDAEVLGLTLRLERVLWPVVALFAVVLFAVSWFAVPAIWGAAFAGSLAPLALLLPGAVAFAAASIPGSYLSGRGRPIDVTVAAAANLGVNIALNAVLVPLWGIVGAGAASLVSYTVAAVIVLLRFRAMTGVGWRATLVPSREDFATMAGAVAGVLRRPASGGAS